MTYRDGDIDICPINGTYHKWFISKTYEVYVPVVTSGIVQLYERQEYAVMGCNCSAVTRKLVVQG